MTSKWHQPSYTIVGVDYDAEPVEPIAHHVEQWYDRHTRSWVTMLCEQNGYQIGKAAYDGTRADAAASKTNFERQIKHEQGAQ